VATKYTVLKNEQLSEEEKNKIKLEEFYRNEIKNKTAKSKSFFDKIDGPIKFLQGLAIALGIFASLWQYRSNSEHERMEAAREYQKSFYQAQMAVYAEAVNAASILATSQQGSDHYIKARQQFFQLFWGRMSIFEDKCVETKMVEFRKLFLKFELKDYTPVMFADSCTLVNCTYDTVTQVTLKMASLRLAHQCRIYTINTWLPENEQKNYNLIDTVSCYAK
jgi:hypothetical protein